MSNHPIRTGPELREETRAAIGRRLSRAGCAIPNELASELLVILDSHQIRLADGRTPVPVGHRSDGTDVPSYQEAKAALAKNRPTTAPRGIPVPARCACACVKGFCQCSADCACAPCPLCHPAPPEPQEGQQ